MPTTKRTAVLLGTFLIVAYVPFEPVLGLWLIVRGFNAVASSRARPVPT